MSEDKSKEKYLGESKLFSTPEKKLVLRLGKGVVGTPNIKNGAVTKEKLSEDVTQYIEDWVSNQIQNIQSGAIHFANDLGSSTDRGITQKALTEIITGLRRQLEILGGRIIPIYWGENKIESRDMGAYYYDPDEEILYVMSPIETDDGEGGTYEISDWRPVMTNTNSLYLRIDTMDMYKALDTDGALFPYQRKEVYRHEMDSINSLNPDIIDNPVYTVIDRSDNDRGKTELGTLSVFKSEDGNTVTQLFTTPYIPEEYEGGLYWDEGEPYGEYPKTYYRTLNTNTGDWTGWQELSAHIDIDTDFSNTSENPIANRVLTAKFEEIQPILDSETEIRYFDDYDESIGVIYSNVEFSGSNGSIVYMVNDNKFALRDGTNYYLNWTVNGTRECDQTEYNINGTVREDRNFLLLSKNNTFAATLDDKLSLSSDHAVRNSVITKAINELKPLIIEYFDPTTQGDNSITANIREKNSSIKDSCLNGRSIFIKRSASNNSSSNTDNSTNPSYWVTRFTIDSNDGNSLICYGIGEDGQYKIRIPKNVVNGIEQPTSINIIKMEGSQNPSVNGSSVILFNDLEDRNLPVANTDGSIWYYYSREDLPNGVYRLSKRKNQDTQTLEEVEPNTGIVYVDINKKLFYRWTGTKFEAISGSGDIATLDTRLNVLETLLGLDKNTGKSEILDDLDNAINDENTGILKKLNDASDSIDNITNVILPDYATKEYVNEGLNTKADKGHRIIMLSYYGSSRPDVTGDSADALGANMKNGIYWLDPTGNGGIFLHRGEYRENTHSIIWLDNDPLLRPELSEEVLYVDRNNKKVYIAKKVTNGLGITSWELIELFHSEEIPEVRRVTINVDTTTDTLTYNYSENGAIFSPRSYAINPSGYIGIVKIYVDGYEYTPGMRLTSGTHTITYTVEAEGFEGDPVSYTVEVSQNQEVLIPFNYSTGNDGDFTIDNSPENITVENVDSHRPQGLYSEYLQSENNLEQDSSGGSESNTYHLWTAQEIGLIEGTTSAIAIANTNKIKIAIADPTCIGFKLDKQYYVQFETLRRNDTPISSLSEGIEPFENGAIKLTKDFILDGGVMVPNDLTGDLEEQAVGGLIQTLGSQGAMFYTNHSLNVRKMHIQSPCYWENDIPYFCIDCRNGIEQLQVEDCIFDRGEGQNNAPAGMYIGFYFNDADPLDQDNFQTKSNYINHVYIKGCTAFGNFIGCNSESHRVLKSFLIINNTINDIRNCGIELGTYGDTEGTYTHKMAYTSCPIWMCGNTFIGGQGVKRPLYNYFCGALIDNCKLYSLHNTFNNFMSAPGVYQNSQKAVIKNADTFDQSFNGRQLYYANNSVLNVVKLFVGQKESGCLKAKKVGYNRPDKTMVSSVRYFKNNTLELCPYDVSQYWEDRPSPINNITNPTEDARNKGTIIGTNDGALNLADILNIKLNTDYESLNVPISTLVFSNNRIDARKESQNPNATLGTGNVCGSNITDSLHAYAVTIENNEINCSKMSSKEWGRYYYDDGNYVYSGDTWLFPIKLHSVTGTNPINVSNNTITIDLISIVKNVNFCLLKYNDPLDASVTQLLISGNHNIIGNSITEGVNFRIGNLNIDTFLINDLALSTDAIPFFNPKFGNQGTINFVGAPDPENITENMVRNADTEMEPLYSSLRDSETGKLPVTTQEYWDEHQVSDFDGQPHLWIADEIGLIEDIVNPGDEDTVLLYDTTANDSEFDGYTNEVPNSSNYSESEVLQIAIDNGTQVQTALNNPTCIGFKLNKLYPILPPGAKVNNNLSDYQNNCIIIPKDAVFDGEDDQGNVKGGFKKIFYKASSGNKGWGHLFYTEYSINLYKFKEVSYKYKDSFYTYFINARNKINQIVVDSCIFTGCYRLPTQSSFKFNCNPYPIRVYCADSIPLPNGKYPADDNCVEHILLKDNTCHGALISNGSMQARVTKSFRIIGNTIDNIYSLGITWNTYNDNKYPQWMAYMSCPMYIVNNTFVGYPILRRTHTSNSSYYGGALIENSVLYVLHNTFSDFISGAGVDSDGNGHNIATYDTYFNGQQLYYADNTVTNVVHLSTNFANSGVLKSKGTGLPEDAFFQKVANRNRNTEITIDAIRYYKNNRFELDTEDSSSIYTVWGTRSSSYTDYPNDEAWDNSIKDHLVDLMHLTIEGHLSFQNNAAYMARCTFSGNIFDAGGGNIVGSTLSGARINTTEFILENNEFTAANMSSNIWNQKFDENLDYANWIISSQSHWLFPVSTYGLWENNEDVYKRKVHIIGNTFNITGDSANIHFYCSAKNSATLRCIKFNDIDNVVIKNNTVTSGSSLLYKDASVNSTVVDIDISNYTGQEE